MSENGCCLTAFLSVPLRFTKSPSKALILLVENGVLLQGRDAV